MAITSRLLLLLTLCLYVFMPQAVMAAPALPAGDGAYSFTNPDTGKDLKVWYYKPAAYTPNSPVVLVLHGLNRNADTYRDSWKPHAEQYGFMLLVPEFTEADFPGTNGYNMGNVFVAQTPDELEGIVSSGRLQPKGLWSYTVADKTFADFAAKRDSTRQDRYYLYGHSAGSQYVHRLLQFVPEARVHMAVTANAGWYTMPNPDVAWPYGLKGTPVSENDAKRFLALPLVVLLGEKDNDPNHRNLRRTPEADLQGTCRLDRGRSFFNYGRERAAALGVPFGWKLQTVPDVAHNDKLMSGAAAAIFAAHAAKK